MGSCGADDVRGTQGEAVDIKWWEQSGPREIPGGEGRGEQEVHMDNERVTSGKQKAWRSQGITEKAACPGAGSRIQLKKAQMFRSQAIRWEKDTRLQDDFRPNQRLEDTWSEPTVPWCQAAGRMRARLVVQRGGRDGLTHGASVCHRAWAV